MKTIDRTELIEKLRVARHRLNAALDKFYSHGLSGDPVAMQAAALDFATSIRVMVHHTPKSTSLLFQIDPSYWDKLIHFRPLIAPPSPDVDGRPTMTTVVPFNLTFGMKGASFTRYRWGVDPTAKMPLKNWWFDPFWDNSGEALSNKDLVLTLTNKEGGAHVDGDVPTQYEAAKKQGYIVISGKAISDVVRLANFAGVAGDELLEYLQDHFPESA